jgi:outer membrane receptor protein involved in Fe transport
VISGADVVKGAQASLTEGAIGGLVNLRSASPFDQRGEHGLVRLEADRNLMSKLNGNKLSAAYSNTFAGDQLGVLFGLVVAHRKERTDIAGNDGGWTRNAVPSDESWQWGNAWGRQHRPQRQRPARSERGGPDRPGPVPRRLDPDRQEAPGPLGQARVAAERRIPPHCRRHQDAAGRPRGGLPAVVLSALRAGPLVAHGGEQRHRHRSHARQPRPELRLNPELLNMTTHRVVDTDLYGINAQWKPAADLSLTGDLYRSTSSRHSAGWTPTSVLRMNQPNVTRIRLTGEPVPEVVTTFADGRDLAIGPGPGAVHRAGFQHPLHEPGRRQHRRQDHRRHAVRRAGRSTRPRWTCCTSASPPPTARSRAT